MVQRTSGFSLFIFTAWFIVLIIEWATIPQFSQADQVIPDDLIVQSSLCTGLDCVNNESFGFDTIRLKENNTRIGFDDTSVGAFPANDWQITANDSASGGANKFSIDDITGAKTPFTITAGAPSASLFIDSIGRVGLRTATPVLDLHVNTSNTPAFRLEQNASGGFSSQTWDVAGNEANFFIRDVTGGSLLPFRIRPGAPTSSLDISASGNVGIGTAAPTSKLTVHGGSSDSTIHLTTQTGIVLNTWEVKHNLATGRLTFGVSGSANVPFKMASTSVDNLLRVGVVASNRVDINGNLVVTGTITPDYVFTPAYKLESIKEHAKFMWRERHLPAVGPGQVNEHGEALINVGARSQGMLEELEKAHIYIEQLHDAIGKLTAENHQLAANLARLQEDFAARLERLEADKQVASSRQ